MNSILSTRKELSESYIGVTIDLKRLGNMPAWVEHKLIKWHFNVFGIERFIDKGEGTVLCPNCEEIRTESDCDGYCSAACMQEHK